MATMYAGPGNVFVPTFDTQANLIVDYSRNWKKYKCLELVTTTPVSKPIGKWLRIKPEAQGNITDKWAQSRRWADGAPMPMSLEGGQKHEWLEYFTERYVEPFFLGYQTEHNAVFDIVKSQSSALANRMMTGIALEIYNALSTAGNYSNTATATSAGGGKWDVATGTNNYIQKSLSYAVGEIAKSTMNVVKPEDLVLVMGPNVAKQVAESQEVRDHVAQQMTAPAYIEGKSGWGLQLGNYGMPPSLYGIKVIVDDLVRDKAALGATTNKEFVAGTTTAYLISRQGALASEAGGSNYSFLHLFRYVGADSSEEFKVEVVDDPLNLRKILRVIDNRQVKPVATEAAFLFTAVVD